MHVLCYISNMHEKCKNEKCMIFGLYMYAFGRHFYPERLCIEGLDMICSCIPWELIP